MTGNGPYQAFCLEITSEIPLQLPLSTTIHATDIDYERVWVTYGPVSHACKHEHSLGIIEYGKSDNQSEIVIHIPQVAYLSLSNDNHVIVEPTAGSDEHLIAQFIVTIVLIFILKRRQLVTLHGSAVAKNSHAIVLLGEQGSGKSTTAAVLTTHGSHMMCDDIVPIGLVRIDESMPTVFPGIPRPKLLHDTYQELFAGSWDVSCLFDGIDKYQVPIETTIGSYPLQFVGILCEDAHCDEVTHRRLQGSEKISRIMEHVSVLNGIESTQEVFMHALRIFQNIPVYEIRRPKGISTVAQVVSVIETLSNTIDLQVSRNLKAQ
jgi:hypothetical protein